MSEKMSLEEMEKWISEEIDKRYVTSFSDRIAAAYVNAQTVLVSRLVDVRLERLKEDRSS